MANDTFKFDRLGDLNPSMVEPDPFVPLVLEGMDNFAQLNLAVQSVFDRGSRNDSQTIMDARVLHVVPNATIFPGDYRPGQTDALNVGDSPYSFTLCYVIVPEAGDVFKLPPDLNRVRTTSAQGRTRKDKQKLTTFTRVYAPGDMTVLPGDVVTINKSSQIVIDNPERNPVRGPRPTPDSPSGSRQAFNIGTPAEEFPFPDVSDLERLAFEAKLYDPVYEGSSFFWADFVKHASTPHLDNTPSAQAQANIIKYAEYMQKLHDDPEVGPFTINSAFRSEEVNSSPTVKGSPKSDHLSGLAADLSFERAVSDADRVRYYREIIPRILPNYDKLIIYEGTTHIHIGMKQTRKISLVNYPPQQYDNWYKYDRHLKSVATVNGIT